MNRREQSIFPTAAMLKSNFRSDSSYSYDESGNYDGDTDKEEQKIMRGPFRPSNFSVSSSSGTSSSSMAASNTALKFVSDSSDDEVENNNEDGGGVEQKIKSKTPSPLNVDRACSSTLSSVVPTTSNVDSSTFVRDSSDDEEEINPVTAEVEYGANSDVSPVSVKLINDETVNLQYNCTQLDEYRGRVLARGVMLTKPIQSSSNFCYFSQFRDGLSNLYVTELNSLQKIVIPHILQGIDCFILGGSKSGKSLSYLMPMVGKLLQGYNDSKPTQCYQPTALIICGDILSAINIKNNLFALFSSINQKQISYDVINEVWDLAKFKTGLDIVISTLYFWGSIIEKSPDIIDYSRLKYFVYDDIDILFRAHSAKFATLHDFIVKISVSRKLSYQRIYAGRQWLPDIEKLYMALTPLDGSEAKLCVPALFINSPNQIIKYAEVKWNLHHVPEVLKIQKLKMLLNSLEFYQHKTVFIMCRNAETAIFVHQELSQLELSNLDLVEMNNMQIVEFNETKQKWDDAVGHSILVLHDEVALRMNVHNVTCLIHYDLPIQTPYLKSSRGASRFSCMWDNFRDIAEEKIDPDTRFLRENLESHFLLTGSETALDKLRDFAVILNCEVPESLVILADKMAMEKMEKLPLCVSLKLFGYCLDSFCKNRHNFLLKELQAETVVPRNGSIEVRVSQCLNPSLFTAQILRGYSYPNLGRRKLMFSWIQKEKALAQDLEDHYKKAENQIAPPSFAHGQICAVKMSDGSFCRARILSVLTRTTGNYPKQVRVFGIDSGFFMQPLAENLYALSGELESITQIAVELVLGDLKTKDSAKTYNAQDISNAQQLVEGKIFNCNVQFAVMDTVWVTPMMDVALDNATGEPATRTSVRLDFISKKLAVHNVDHMSNIIQLCRKTGYACPELDDKECNPAFDLQFMDQFQTFEDRSRWAFVRCSGVQNPVPFKFWPSFTKDPYHIYGTNDHFCKILESLNHDLNGIIEIYTSGKCVQYSTQFAHLYKVGLVVACKDKSSASWCRGLITQACTEDDTTVYDVFFVDIGDVQLKTGTKDLFPMPRKLVEQLPFQAVCFKLGHISPIDNSDSWNQAVIDHLMDLTLNEEDNAVLMDPVVTFEEIQDETVPCRYYTAMMIPEGSNDDMGSILVQMGLASFVEDGQENIALAKKILHEINNIQVAKFLCNDDGEDGCNEDPDETELFGFNDRQLFEMLGLKYPGDNLDDKRIAQTHGLCHDTIS